MADKWGGIAELARQIAGDDLGEDEPVVIASIEAELRRRIEPLLEKAYFYANNCSSDPQVSIDAQAELREELDTWKK